MMNYNECDFITEFRGEFADDYDTHYKYVESGAWEKDYFASWLETCSDYPNLKEIEVFAHEVRYYLGHWFAGVEAGKINPEACVLNAKIEEMVNTLTDEEIADIGREIGVDYSYTTFKEAKYMICEDYLTGVRNTQKDGFHGLLMAGEKLGVKIINMEPLEEYRKRVIKALRDSMKCG